MPLSVIFIDLQHLTYYNITVRAYNQLGPSTTNTFLSVQTKDVSVTKEGTFCFLKTTITTVLIFLLDLSIIEHSLLHSAEKAIHYRLNDSIFALIKVPLCIKIEMYNQTNVCERLVTSSGYLKFDENDLNKIVNLSICLDQYDDFCGESVPVAISKISFVLSL